MITEGLEMGRPRFQTSKFVLVFLKIFVMTFYN